MSYRATPSLFSTLRVEPVMGRLPTEKDENEKVVVISHRLWMTWFGGDRVGARPHVRHLKLLRRPWSASMGPEFRFPQEETAAWIHDSGKKPVELGNFDHNVVGRLSPGADYESLRAELTALARRNSRTFRRRGQVFADHRAISSRRALAGGRSGREPEETALDSDGHRRDRVAHRVRERGKPADRPGGEPSRRHGRAFRTRRCARSPDSFSYGRSLTLAALGGVGGVLLAWVGVPLLVRAAPENIPRLNSVGVDATALLFTAGVATLAALASGFLPALRFSNLEIMSGLRQLPSGWVGAERLDSRRTRRCPNCGGPRAAGRLGAPLQEFS